MKRLLSTLAVIVFCASVPLQSARAQVSDAELMAQLNLLLEQIVMLQALIEAEDTSVQSDDVRTYVYDSRREFEVSYQNREQLTGELTREDVDGKQFELYKDGSTAAVVMIMSAAEYDSFLFEMELFDERIAEGVDIDEDISILSAPAGFTRDTNGFETKETVIMEDGLVQGLLISIKSIEHGTQAGGVIIVSGWGLANPATETFRSDVYFDNEVEARAFHDSVIEGIDISPEDALDGLSDLTFEEALEEARLRGEDAALRVSLNNLRAVGEIYYDENSNSYRNVCTGHDEWSEYFTDAIDEYDADCDDGSTAYAVSAELSDGTYYCIDSNGHAGSSERKKSSNATSCPTN